MPESQEAVRIKSMRELLETHSDLKTTEREIKHKLQHNHEQLINACIAEGAHDCLTLNFRRINNYFFNQKASR